MSCYDEKNQCSCELQAAVRNRYYYGKQMGVDQFRREQAYHREQRHLVHRLTLGSRILCGLDVTIAEDGDIHVEPGVAIDGWGRVVIVPEPQVLVIDEDLEGNDIEVRLCYRECCILPAPAPCGDPCHPNTTKQYDAIQESFELSVHVTEANVRQEAIEGMREEIEEIGDDGTSDNIGEDIQLASKTQTTSKPWPWAGSRSRSCDCPEDPCIQIAELHRNMTGDDFSVTQGTTVGPKLLEQRIVRLEHLVEKLVAQITSGAS